MFFFFLQKCLKFCMPSSIEQKNITVYFFPLVCSLFLRNNVCKQPSVFQVASFGDVQNCSKVSWQSLEPRSLSFETRSSILISFEYRVVSLELRVEKVNEIVAWMISWEINWTNGPQTKYVYMQTTSLGAIVLLALESKKQIITKLRATDSIVNTDKDTRVLSCDQLC